MAEISDEELAAYKALLKTAKAFVDHGSGWQRSAQQFLGLQAAVLTARAVSEREGGFKFDNRR